MRVAAIDAGKGGLGEGGFDAEDVGGTGFGVVGGVSGEGEQMLDVGDVLLAELHAFAIGLEVIVAIGQTEPTGADADDDRGGVDGVLIGAGTEEEAAHRGVLKGGDGLDELGAGVEVVDAGELRGEGFEAGGVDGGGVHAGGEEVAYLLLDGRAIGGGDGIFLEDSPKELLVVVGELAVDGPGGLVSGDGIFGLPAAAGEFVEVGAGVDGAVEAGEIERGRVGHGGEGLLGGGEGHKGEGCGREGQQGFEGHEIS